MTTYTMEDVTVKNEEYCGNCKHYQEAYCNLMDELVEPLDHCGMCDTGSDNE